MEGTSALGRWRGETEKSREFEETALVREIAEVLGCPIGTVMSRLSRGRGHPRRTLAQFAREHGYLRGDGMNCSDVHARLHPYVDGELPVGETVAADAHVADCGRCADLVRQEQEFRQLLRRQPRELVPPEFRERLVARVRSQARRRLLRPWLLAPGLAAVAAMLVAVVLWPTRPAPSLIGELVDKHIAYAQIDRPAELASGDRQEVSTWFRERAGMRVTVPDYSPSGIRLVGARLADAHERKAAYLLYEKGHTLLSVFMVPVGAVEAPARAERLSYRGHDYVGYERKGYRTVSWTDGQTLFGLVSMLDYDVLFECADRLRTERQNLTRL